MLTRIDMTAEEFMEKLKEDVQKISPSELAQITVQGNLSEAQSQSNANLSVLTHMECPPRNKRALYASRMPLRGVSRRSMRLRAHLALLASNSKFKGVS